mmetsp:Transcript_1782/g.6366  ORF Transcript_1782/g.6366 Transcript_1782/m.6366 type:complete len:227 (-) Transcript_1782:140-820(-)
MLPTRSLCTESARLPHAAIMRRTWWYLPSCSVILTSLVGPPSTSSLAGRQGVFSLRSCSSPEAKRSASSPRGGCFSCTRYCFSRERFPGLMMVFTSWPSCDMSSVPLAHLSSLPATERRGFSFRNTGGSRSKTMRCAGESRVCEHTYPRGLWSTRLTGEMKGSGRGGSPMRRAAACTTSEGRTRQRRSAPSSSSPTFTRTWLRSIQAAAPLRFVRPWLLSSWSTRP